jgi:hypothetical protein
MAGSWLNPGGKVVAITSNSESLHRQDAVKMGSLVAANAFSERDRVQAKREYSVEKNFTAVFECEIGNRRL